MTVTRNNTVREHVDQTRQHLTKRQQKALQTRDNIFQAAMQAINEKGFQNTTIEDITSLAHVASGSFYTYFPSKEAIVLETLRQSDVIYEWAFQQTRDEPFFSRITNFIHLSYIEYEKRGKGIIKAIISNYYSFPPDEIYPPDRPLLVCIKHIIEAGLAAGEIDPGHTADEYTLQFLSAMAGVEVMWCFETSNKSLAELMVDTFRTMAAGVMIRK